MQICRLQISLISICNLQSEMEKLWVVSRKMFAQLKHAGPDCDAAVSDGFQLPRARLGAFLEHPALGGGLVPRDSSELGVPFSPAARWCHGAARR